MKIESISNAEVIIIEEMKISDLDSVLEIEKNSFSDPWTEEMFRAEMSQLFSYLWISRNTSGMLTGYICFWLLEGEVHVLNLAVHPACRHRGIGSRLIEVSLDYWKKTGMEHAYLEVRESNEAARRIYERFGFRMIARRRRYYRYPKEDALVMTLEIT